MKNYFGKTINNDTVYQFHELVSKKTGEIVILQSQKMSIEAAKGLKNWDHYKWLDCFAVVKTTKTHYFHEFNSSK